MKRIIIFSLFCFSCLIAHAQNEDTEITSDDIKSARKIRTAELNDPIRPCWHLTISEGSGYPFDPNGAIFINGVYHLWYLYQGNAGQQWQHLSSIDLFHWRWHSNDLQHHEGDPDKGIFSGNAFLADDGNVVISYHGLETGGNCVAYSNVNDLNHWEKPKTNPISKPGWDPHTWLENGTYYQISGGVPVSSGKPNPAVLYSGKSYKEPLKQVGEFMSHDMPGVDDFEDISCPDFFKLGDKWVLVCISHIRGARYYIGSWDGKQFKPESHHRMNWPGGTVFAPETLLDSKGRRILWTWVLDRKTGVSSGTMSMPRILTLAKDKKSLNIEPPKEVESLRYNPSGEKPFTVQKGQPVTLDKVSGKVMEMDITIDPGKAKVFGLKVFCSKDKREQTPVIINLNKNILQIDMTKSSLEKVDYREFVMVREPNPVLDTQEAPFALKQGEKLNLRIFLDKSVLEVFANGRQCITQVVYPTLKDAVHVEFFTEDEPVKVEKAKAWELFPAMQW